MIFVDANVFIAYANTDDALHKTAVELWQMLEKGTFGKPVTSEYVFHEVVGVTLRKLDKKQAILIGNYVRSGTTVIPSASDIFAGAWDLFAKTTLGFNLVDCATVTLLQKTGVKHIATFDKEFQKMSGLVVVSCV